MSDPKIKEISVSSKRSIQVGSEYFTFECSETIDVSEVPFEMIGQVKRDAYERCNLEVDEQCVDAKNI